MGGDPLDTLGVVNGSEIVRDFRQSGKSRQPSVDMARPACVDGIELRQPCEVLTRGRDDRYAEVRADENSVAVLRLDHAIGSLPPLDPQG